MVKQLSHLTDSPYKWERRLLRLNLFLFISGVSLTLLGGVLLGLAMWFDPTAPGNQLAESQPPACQLEAGCTPVIFAVKPADTLLTLDSAPPVKLDAPAESQTDRLKAVEPDAKPIIKSAGDVLPRKSAGDVLPRKSARDVLPRPAASVTDCLICDIRRQKESHQPATGVSPNPAPVDKSVVVDTEPAAVPQSASAKPTETDSTSSEAVANPVPLEAAPPQVSALAANGCPTSSAAQFELIPVERANVDHPDRYHADLNLSLRGFIPTQAPLTTVQYNGQTATDPPQLVGLFEPNRRPTIQATYQIYDWLWNCATNPHGCRGEAIQDWGVTLIGLATTPGEIIQIPERRSDIYQGRFRALVLYATEQQITLGYTRRDSVALGYVIHLKNLCVDANLLALYRAQNDEAGWRRSGQLPALNNHQAIGTARGHELQVAIRDNGAFLDPRSSKDWWQ